MANAFQNMIQNPEITERKTLGKKRSKKTHIGTNICNLTKFYIYIKIFLQKKEKIQIAN